ncbi:MAG TPA: HD domain-containing phosphohydrolase [Pyrinomonadaceae bacterium]|jgi:response regulator RpfG family c-di-GMP phosphodiesterase|nr:HD domain-containing phosphohydrolase [Pyrinomonadaceae bacterium]
MSQASDPVARILIVDDEPEINSLLCDLLNEQYECASAGSAEEALGLLREEHFTLVISDITMTGMSGLEMVPHVLGVSPQTVVVLVSGSQTIESAIEALRVGAFDYIMKPFDLRQVEAVVKRAIEHYELRESKRRHENHLEELVEQRTAELDRALDSLEDAYRMTLKALAAALETRDHETHGHSQRVVSFSLRLGYELGVEREQLRSLEFGSLLHDIGKIGVPDAILRKPAALDEDEWIKMRKHPLHGQQILSGIEFLEGASRVVAQHHEKWDGSGYPLGLRGEEIDLNARIFAVADAFDALTSDRVYRTARSYEAASEELDRCAGQHFDPKIVEMFHRVSQEEWEALRQHPLQRREEEASLGRQPSQWAAPLESRLDVPVS